MASNLIPHLSGVANLQGKAYINKVVESMNNNSIFKATKTNKTRSLSDLRVSTTQERRR